MMEPIYKPYLTMYALYVLSHGIDTYLGSEFHQTKVEPINWLIY